MKSCTCEKNVVSFSGLVCLSSSCAQQSAYLLPVSNILVIMLLALCLSTSSLEVFFLFRTLGFLAVIGCSICDFMLTVISWIVHLLSK